MNNYKEERPWGNFEVLYDGPDCKVKRITVYPKKRLSLQSHKYRRELWTVVSGVLGVVFGEDEDVLYEKYIFAGSYHSIGLGWIHRAFNDTNENVVFIEVQTGTYFGEDDIIRYEDDFGRI